MKNLNIEKFEEFLFLEKNNILISQKKNMPQLNSKTSAYKNLQLKEELTEEHFKFISDEDMKDIWINKR